ncbi:MAG: HAD family hydrolase, partial [Longimicrobiales bacterium]|nr:HAD family hydrolase [Longimicrobiales bacterium]
RRVADAKEARYRTLLEREGVTALPGAREWVRTLHDAGWRQAVASSAPRRNVDLVLDRLGLRDRIDAVVGSEDVAQGKPAPDVFLQAADRVGSAPSRCVVVEDAEVGIEAARRAGMPCIGIGVAADVTVASPAELPGDTFERMTG